MKAAWYEKNGPARECLVVGEMDDTQPGPAEVGVRVITSGVNPSDVKSRMSRPLGAPRIIPHSDGAGIVVSVGPGVSSSRIGERVWLWNAQWGRPHGSACEMLNIASSHAVKMPDHLDFESAACLGIPALTALQATRLCGPLEGKTVLVTGAGSAVGHYASQMARMAGAHVIGTVGSAARAAHALSAGVEHLINYKTESIVDEVARITEGKGVDCVIDMDFSSTCQLLQTQAIANHSKVVCYGSNSPDVGMPFRPLLWKSVDLKFMLVYDLKPKDREECLASLNEMLVNKALVHAVAKTTTLEDIASAHEWVESGKVIGNVVLQVQKP